MKEGPMRFERLRINIIAAALMFARTLSASPASPAPSNAAWESLKTLQGEWEGVYEGSMKTRVGYRLVSNGTALMETLVSPESGDMVTMYHADGPVRIHPEEREVVEPTSPDPRPLSSSASSSDGSRCAP
jgi:hypothetical protein